MPGPTPWFSTRPRRSSRGCMRHDTRMPRSPATACTGRQWLLDSSGCLKHIAKALFRADDRLPGVGGIYAMAVCRPTRNDAPEVRSSGEDARREPDVANQPGNPRQTTNPSKIISAGGMIPAGRAELQRWRRVPGKRQPQPLRLQDALLLGLPQTQLGLWLWCPTVAEHRLFRTAGPSGPPSAGS